jgi:hypothetical protein
MNSFPNTHSKVPTEVGSGVGAGRRGRRLAVTLGVLLLGVQAGGVLASRFKETRYLCWAPYDEIAEFELSVWVGGRELGGVKAAERYRLPHASRDNRSWAHVPAVVAHYERTRGQGEDARVEYRHRINGGAERVWRWPEDAR